MSTWWWMIGAIAGVSLLAGREAWAGGAAAGADPPGSKRVHVSIDVIYADPDSINEIARNHGATSQADSFYYGVGNEVWVPFPDPKGGLYQKAYFLTGYEIANKAFGPANDVMGYGAKPRSLQRQMQDAREAIENAIILP